MAIWTEFTKFGFNQSEMVTRGASRNLREDREGHAIIELAKLLDFLVRARLLVPELVAGKGQNF